MKKLPMIVALSIMAIAIFVVGWCELSPITVSQTLNGTITKINPETGEFTAVTDVALDSPFISANAAPMKEFRSINGLSKVQALPDHKVGDRLEMVVATRTAPPLPLIGDGHWVVEFYIASATNP